MTILKILQLVFALGMARYGLSLSDEVEDFMARIDGKVSGFVKLVAQSDVQPTLNKVANFFLYLAIIFLFALLTSNYVLLSDASRGYFLAYTAFSSFAWISIRWFTSFKKFFLQPALMWLKLFLWIFALPIIDLIAESNLTELTYQFIGLLLEEPFSIFLPKTENDFVRAALIFTIYVCSMSVFLLVSSVYFGLFALVAISLIWATLYSFQLIDKIWSKNHLTGICTVGFILTVVLDWF